MPTSFTKTKNSLASLEREALRYCDESLGPAIGLTNPQRLSQNARGQVFVADSAQGRIVVKFYPNELTTGARRCAVAHSVFREGGLTVPDLVWQDTDEPESGRLACLAYRFVPGDHYRPGEGERERLLRGFENLAKVHSIPAAAFCDPYPSAMPPRSLDHDWPLGSGSFDYYDTEESFCDLFRQALGPFGRIDTGPFCEWLADARAVDVTRLPAVMLHGDYQKNNVIFGAGGAPVTLDLDNARTGRFCRELGVALLRWRYGGTSKIPHAVLDDTRRDEVIQACEASYLAAAAPESAAYWREHREIFLVAAYVRALRILLERACEPDRYGPIKRLRFSQLALVGWRRFATHVKDHAPSPRTAAASRAARPSLTDVAT